MVTPGVVCGLTSSGQHVIVAPRGMLTVDSTDPPRFVAALLASHALLQGSPTDLKRLVDLLDCPATSRTASFLCGLGTDCATVLESFERLRCAHIALVGCGGIGSLAALAVAGAGIQRLTLIDPDVIDASNLNRQFVWTRADIGAPKVAVLQRAIQARYESVSVAAVAGAVDVRALDHCLDDADVVLVSADEPFGIGRLLCEQALRLDVFVVQAGYTVADAGYRVFGPSATLNESSGCVWVRPPGAIMPSFGPLNAELAGIASDLALSAAMGALPPDVHRVNHWSHVARRDVS